MANAVMDGADAFLLGAETLRGFHPVLTIATILSIARQAEAVFDHTHHFDHLMTVWPLPCSRNNCFSDTIAESRTADWLQTTRRLTNTARLQCRITGGADQGDDVKVIKVFEEACLVC